MTIEIDVDKHKAVGPLVEMYGHGPVTVIQDEEVRDHSTDEGTTLFTCLDCGFTTGDNRRFAHEECDRAENTITQTWREWIATERDVSGTVLPEDGAE